MQRLGKNIGGYRGENINLEKVLAEIKNLADTTGWHRDFFSTPENCELLAFRRQSVAPRHRIYLSSGMHGDEPAGPLAVLELLRQNRWPDTVDIWLCPCLNLTGFQAGRRENALGIDLNRDYKHLRTPEIRTHTAWLEKQPQFDLCLCLHEDWEAHGFYLYELNPDHRASFAEDVVRAVEKSCPIDHSPLIDGREARGGMIRPDIDPDKRPEWPEAFYLITHKTRQSYTLESPSDFPLDLRVQALVVGVQTAIEKLAARPSLDG